MNAFTHSKTLAGIILGASMVVGAMAHGADQATLPLDTKESSLKFYCESFMHNFHGEAQEMSGKAEVNLRAAPPVQTATLHFKTTALTTFIKARDEKMYDWLHVQMHPEAVFQLQSVKLVSGDYKLADPQHPAEFKVTGMLTLNGLQQPISGTAKGWRDNDRLVVSGETVVDTLSYGLPQIRMAVLTVGTNVKTSYTFRFVLPPEYAKK